MDCPLDNQNYLIIVISHFGIDVSQEDVIPLARPLYILVRRLCRGLNNEP